MARFYIKSMLLCSSLLITLYSCNNGDTQKEAVSVKDEKQVVNDFASYKILRNEPYETTYKAQVKCYAYLTDDSFSKEKLEATLNLIYSNLKTYNNFKNFSAPTVIGVYLFTSEEKAKSMPDSWIGMLVQGPSDSLPRITINTMKLKAMVKNGDTKKSKDDLMYEKLETYFEKRNTDLCSIYQEIYKLEEETIKRADEKFPDFGLNHSKYQQKLYRKEQSKLFNKYKINDTLSTYITVFGMSYCK